MSAIFVAMGFDVITGRDAVTLRYELAQLDLSLLQKIIFALYYLMGSIHQTPTTEPAGILPCQENVDKEIWSFCLNYCQNDDVSVGVARLYCDDEGWDFNSALHEIRDPTAFTEAQRLAYKTKYESLAGCSFDETIAADLKLAEEHAIVDLRVQVSNGSTIWLLG